ncbi:hypothetical protein ABZ569_25355 [Streptomyces albus]|uniref:hypothetical protein n=1 Tax=Streptomyces albus TaxID=1888 RepID=UPI0033CA4A62
MTDPRTAPIPPVPPQPHTRPLHKRALVWVGGSALFLAGVLIGTAGDDGQQPAAEAKPAATVTATPKPGPTVTKTVKPTPKPAPTVTVTKTATPEAPDTGTDTSTDADSTDSTETGSGTCSIVSNSGNCYSAGQFCRNSDHGATTSTASGRTIKCTYSANSWRWTYN